MKTVPKEELLVCLPVLYANLEDRNADVRKNASEALVGFMYHLGYSPMMSACEKLKPASSIQVRGLLDKARCLVPERPAPPGKGGAKGGSAPGAATAGGGGAAAKGAAKMGPGSSATITKSSSKLKTANSAKSSSAGSRKGADEEADITPLLPTNNLKNQRVIDEQKLKTLKWNFTTPRDEFVDLLRDQMTTAGVNKALIANMFHPDFKFHLKAIDQLNEDLGSHLAALACNLDLILRWMTLRFFDTNPSVILKGLEYLQTAFNMLIDDDYIMLENEASAFIPYLVLKVGDPKDAVRNSVRALFKQIVLMYPVSKFFTYIMDGLKSKNARQRSECLEQLGYLIESVGTTVCQPSAGVALKEIAKHISDRDNSVRNGALNCIVAAYFLDGEKVLKTVGQISDKDMSLLEERIKRAAKNRPVASIRPMQPAVANVNQPMPKPASARRAATPDELEQDVEPEVEEEVEPEQPQRVQATPQRSDSSDHNMNCSGELEAPCFEAVQVHRDLDYDDDLDFNTSPR
ncbi:protein mini spindles-like [Nilaparvata lugens]|uniref:protein mini spindles-like n=1 Tax=Nilaparvata lugens TaxID=108931 RepID=UPI00193DE9A1|nr:protein mini spindles-like [Nilaparvata lugens]